MLCSRSCAAGITNDLTLLGPNPAPLLADAHAAVAIQSKKWLDPDEQVLCDAEFLAAVIPQLDQDWILFREMFDDLMATQLPRRLLREFLRVFESAGSDDLRLYLGRLLLKAAGAPPTTPLTEVSRVVRLYLNDGYHGPVDTRWEQLSATAQPALNRIEATSAEPIKLLEEIVELARCSLLGCALHQQERGIATFDTLSQQPASDLFASLRPGPRATAPVPADVLAQMNRTLVGAGTATKRRQLVRELGESLQQFPAAQPSPSALAAMGAYTVRELRAEDPRQAAELAAVLCPFESYLLGMADALGSGASLQELPGLEAIMTAVLAPSIGRLDGNQSLAAYRRALLDSVAGELATPLGSAAPFVDSAESFVLEIYLMQGKLLGVAFEEPPDSPTAALGSILAYLAEDSQIAAGDAAALRSQAKLLRYLTAVGELGLNPVQHLVLLERGYLVFLFEQHISNNDARQSASRQILADLALADANAEGALVQLRDGQAALVRAWLLVNRTTGRGIQE